MNAEWFFMALLDNVPDYPTAALIIATKMSMKMSIQLSPIRGTGITQNLSSHHNITPPHDQSDKDTILPWKDKHEFPFYISSFGWQQWIWMGHEKMIMTRMLGIFSPIAMDSERCRMTVFRNTHLVVGRIALF